MWFGKSVCIQLSFLKTCITQNFDFLFLFANFLLFHIFTFSRNSSYFQAGWDVPVSNTIEFFNRSPLENVHIDSKTKAGFQMCVSIFRVSKCPRISHEKSQPWIWCQFFSWTKMVILKLPPYKSKKVFLHAITLIRR